MRRFIYERGQPPISVTGRWRLLSFASDLFLLNLLVDDLLPGAWPGQPAAGRWRHCRRLNLTIISNQLMGEVVLGGTYHKREGGV